MNKQSQKNESISQSSDTRKNDRNMSAHDKWTLVIISICAAVSLTLMIMIFSKEIGYGTAISVKTAVVEGRDPTGMIVLSQDTVRMMKSEEYEGLLSQLREQNQHLVSIFNIAGMFGTIVAAFVGLFLWRIQKKYDDWKASYEEAKGVNDQMTSLCGQADTAVSSIDKKLKEIESAVNSGREALSLTVEDITKQLNDALKVVTSGIDRQIASNRELYERIDIQPIDDLTGNSDAGEIEGDDVAVD